MTTNLRTNYSANTNIESEKKSIAFTKDNNNNFEEKNENQFENEISSEKDKEEIYSKKKKYFNDSYNLKKKVFVRLLRFLMIFCNEILREIKKPKQVLNVNSLIKKKPSDKNIINIFQMPIEEILVLQKSKSDKTKYTKKKIINEIIAKLNKNNQKNNKNDNNFQKIINMTLKEFFLKIYLSNNQKEVKSKFKISADNIMFFDDFLKSRTSDEDKEDYKKLIRHLIQLSNTHNNLDKGNIFKIINVEENNTNQIYNSNILNNIKDNILIGNQSISDEHLLSPNKSISSLFFNE